MQRAKSSPNKENVIASKSPQFDEVCRAELPVLYRIAQKLTLNPTKAEDLVGQTLYLAAKAWPQFDGQYPRSWMIKIMRNEFLGAKRTLAGKAQNEELTEFIQSKENVSDAALSHVDHERILQELEKLPEEYRLAITLCDIEELSYEEAAIAMDVPMGTVRSRLFRGRHLLRDRLM